MPRFVHANPRRAWQRALRNLHWWRGRSEGTRPQRRREGLGLRHATTLDLTQQLLLPLLKPLLAAAASRHRMVCARPSGRSERNTGLECCWRVLLAPPRLAGGETIKQAVAAVKNHQLAR